MPNRNRASSPPPGRVLVVEDDAVLAMAIEDALRDAGAKEVVTCATIAQTLEQLDLLRPDVLVVDVHLADRSDGWALAELVPQLGPRPPQIIFSTGSPEAIPPEIAEMGTVLAKPYDPADLVAAIASRRRGLFSRLLG